jgi:methyl-accepting chemotaxis protein
MTQDIRAFISGIGDTSFLILDPDLDTYYVMDIVLLRAPETQNLIADVARLSGEVARAQSRSFEQLTQLVQYTDRLTTHLAGLNGDVKVALQNNSSGSFNPYALPDSVNNALGETQKFIDLVNAQLVKAETITVQPDEVATAAQRAQDAQTAFYNKASEALLVGIQARERRYMQTLVIGLVIALGGIIIGFVLGLLIMLAISRPLNELTHAAQRLGTGDLSVRVNVANGDETGKVGQAFNDFIDTLAGIVRGLVDNSTKLSSSATQLAATSAELSAGADSQTQQVIRTSTAMEEMSATIKDMARNANTTSVAAEAAVQRALLGSAKVQAALTGITQTNHTLQQLQERSAEIDAVVRLIADIAAQTNILALNAAIEAAGAGAAGARFDVVAEEIRKLAGRTAESTSRISATVAEVQRQIQSGAIQMSETAAQAAAVEQALSEIVDGITSVNDMVTLVSTSTTQQAKAADQVAESLQLITQVSQQTAQAMRESTTTIDDLSNLARGMNVTAGRFKT